MSEITINVLRQINQARKIQRQMMPSGSVRAPGKSFIMQAPAHRARRQVRRGVVGI